MLLRADGRIEELKPGGPIFSGVIEHESYCECDTVVEPGDVLVLYTDGVVEVMNDDQEEFGIGRLMEILKRSRDLPVEEIIGEVVRATQEFTGFENSEDDFTLVVVRRE